MATRSFIRHTVMAAATTAATITPSALHWWFLDQIEFKVLTDATVANRYFIAEIRDAAQVFATIAARGLVAASTSVIIRMIGAASAQLPVSATVNVALAPNSGQWFPPGSSIVLKVVNPQSGDAYTDLTVSIVTEE